MSENMLIWDGVRVLTIGRSSFSYIVHPRTHAHPHTHIPTHPHTSTHTRKAHTSRHTPTRTPHKAVGHRSIDLKKQARSAHAGFASYLERRDFLFLVHPGLGERTENAQEFVNARGSLSWVESAGEALCRSRRPVHFPTASWADLLHP